ncbi:hypothetical protein HGM15179_011835 [Zosterops borbonicus]|uniref:Uncharacterized protein n=1 Tax=Zosterops borbonicus TaxID=364589 RepID=A0A8K1GBT2_9PASS|nr:hypothetical protein HGM15179_011835 [Zosterops borbonicus]
MNPRPQDPVVSLQWRVSSELAWAASASKTQAFDSEIRCLEDEQLLACADIITQKIALLIAMTENVFVCLFVFHSAFGLIDLRSFLILPHKLQKWKKQHLWVYDSLGTVCDISPPLEKFALSLAYKPSCLIAWEDEKPVDVNNCSGFLLIARLDQRVEHFCWDRIRRLPHASGVKAAWEDEKPVDVNNCSGFLLIARLDQRVEHFCWDRIRRLPHASGVKAGEFCFKLALFWCKGQNGHSSWRTVNLFLNPIVQFDLI